MIRAPIFLGMGYLYCTGKRARGKVATMEAEKVAVVQSNLGRKNNQYKNSDSMQQHVNSCSR